MSRKGAEIEPKSDEYLQLGDFRFLIKTNELQDSEGHSVALRSQSADVLAHLAAHAGTLVSKETLIEAVWGETFVTDDSLVQCIGDIRRVLGDTDQKIVQTFPKKGYRLNAELMRDRGGMPPERRRRWLPALGAMAAVAIVGTFAWLSLADSPPPHGDEKPRIAVLAFDDFSTGEDKGYLSDAIVEGIITDLARRPLIDVISRQSSFRYRGTGTDLRQIGDELGVHYLLEGSQQKDGDRLRVTVQLIEADEGTHLWAHSYDQTIADLFTVQDSIIRTVASRIGFQIERPVPGADPEKVTALHLHLKSLEVIKANFNEKSNAEFIELNRRAIEADPDAVWGHYGLALGYRNAATFGWHGLDRDESLERGFSVAERALELDPDDSGVPYAFARLYDEAGERELAMASYEKAIELNPSASNYLVASTSSMLYAGHKEEAIDRIKQAMGIDPFHEDWYHWQMGWALWETDDCDGALAAMQTMKNIPRGAHRMLAGIYACLGEVEKARQAYKVFYADAKEPTISEQREEWKDVWTAPGSLERWLDHMRIAGMKD